MKKFFLFLLLTVITTCANATKGPSAKAKKGVDTWGTAPQLVEPNNMPPALGLSHNTLRQVVCVSIGGKRLRLKFSNMFGKSPVTMMLVQWLFQTCSLHFK